MQPRWELSVCIDGIPSLETVREADWAKGTNFRNLEDMVVSLHDPKMQEYVFGMPAIIENVEDLTADLPRKETDDEELEEQPIPF